MSDWDVERSYHYKRSKGIHQGSFGGGCDTSGPGDCDYMIQSCSPRMPCISEDGTLKVHYVKVCTSALADGRTHRCTRRHTDM